LKVYVLTHYHSRGRQRQLASRETLALSRIGKNCGKFSY
jgi:hypothetical protein